SQQGRSRQAAQGELAGPAEKLALGDFSVHVMVVKFEQLGCEIFGCQSRHGVSFLLAGANEPACFDYEAIAMDDPGFFQWGQTPPALENKTPAHIYMPSKSAPSIGPTPIL